MYQQEATPPDLVWCQNEANYKVETVTSVEVKRENYFKWSKSSDITSIEVDLHKITSIEVNMAILTLINIVT